MVWVMPSPTGQGHWRRPRSGEIAQRSKANADHIYRITNVPINSYRGPKQLRLDNISENLGFLSDPQVESPGLTGRNGMMNVHYVSTVKLGAISLSRQQDHVLVTDTLLLQPAGPFVNSFIAIDGNGQPFLKVIAGTIIYESPALLSLSGARPGDFIFSCDSLFFKSVYDNLQPAELQPAPPVTVVPQGLTLNVYRASNGDIEKNLLNRLYVKLMEQCFSRLSTNADDWVTDRLVESFQGYRFKKVRPANLGMDPSTQQQLASVVAQFESAYGNYAIRRLRSLNGTTIIADGDIRQVSFRPLQYFAVPSVANLQPLIGDSTLGSILYTGTGDADLRLWAEVELGYDSTVLDSVAAQLAARGLTLQPRLKQDILVIPEQPLKIDGHTIGRIVPISNTSLRLEMNITEGTKNIADWFPKAGHAVFNIDATAGREGPAVSQQIQLRVDPHLLERLDYTQPLKSFHVVERTALTGDLKISSNLSASREKEGALNYAEVLLDLRFGERSVLYGPYRLSAYNTLAAEVIVPFVKYDEQFKVIVSGRAVYDNGEININPFETTSGVIVLDDAALNAR